MPDRATRVGDSPRSGIDPPARPGRRRRESAELDAISNGPKLELEEALLIVLRGIGAVMFLTTRRVIVARDGIARRPRSGVASFPLEQIRHLRLELGSGPSGRIAVWTDASQEAVSMFFDARSLDRAHELIDIARPQIARQRRRGPGERPVRPPTGPADSGPSDPA
ncbi:MAG: hypothetical protein QOI00_944 [Chloroflexota bacterium]|nr:hypothetical protein [Chloroflexota bacterium]